MMDVYHEDFRGSIAIDVRIKAISTALGVSFNTYEEHEQFYLDVAAEAGLNGWELDRLLFWFRAKVEQKLQAEFAHEILNSSVASSCPKTATTKPTSTN